MNHLPNSLWLPTLAAILLFLIQFTAGISQDLSSLHEESYHCFRVLPDRSGTDDNNYLISLPFQNYTHSIETFINLVEKIEDRLEERGRRLPADLMVKLLLRKFNVEGLKVERREKFEQRVKGKLRNNLIDSLLDASGGSTTRFDLTDIIDEEEHCTLFYMLSRFVLPMGKVQINAKFSRIASPSSYGNTGDSSNERGGALSRIINYGIDPRDIPSASRDPSNRNPFTFYEQGVVRFRSSETDAIQLNRVLIGILAGLTNTPQVTSFELYERLSKFENTNKGRSTPSISTVSLNQLRNEKRRIDPIAMLTLGDLWAIWQSTTPSISISSPNPSNRITSMWNSPYCPVYFQIQSPFQFPQAGINAGASIGPDMVQFSGVSASELRGGIDGLSIGSALTTMRQARSALKLSQILKVYYTGKGFASPAGEANVCRRSELVEFYSPQLIHSAVHYLQFIDLISSQVYTPEPKAAQALKMTQHDFLSKLSDAAMLGDSNRVWCAEQRFQMSSGPSAYGYDSRGAGSSNGRFGGGRDYNQDESSYNGNSLNGLTDPYAESQLPGYAKQSGSSRYQPTNFDASRAECDTPVDLLFVVDLSNQVAQQLAIVSRILTELPPAHKETVTMLANRPGTNGERSGLDIISWRERVKEKTICDLQNAMEERNVYTINRAEELINRLDFTLSRFKQEQNESLVVHGKTIILFNFGFVKRDQSQDFYAAKRILQNHHRLVKFLVIGQGEREDLRSLVVNARDPDEHIFADSSDLPALGNAIARSVCEAPVSIQYDRCNTTESRYQDVTRNLFVRPMATEYVAVSAEYLHSSERVWIRFSVPGERKIRVCASRSLIRAQDETNDRRDCRDLAQQNDRYIEFKYDNPCYDESKESCASIYFALIGLPGGAPDCFESECSNADQIRVEISHYGMLCNSALAMAKPLLWLFVVQLVLFKFVFSRQI